MGFKDRLKDMKSKVAATAYTVKVQADAKRHDIRDSFSKTTYAETMEIPKWTVETKFMGMDRIPYFVEPKAEDDVNDPVTIAVRKIGSRSECVSHLAHLWGESDQEERQRIKSEAGKNDSPSNFDDFLKEQFNAAKADTNKFNPINDHPTLPKLPEAGVNTVGMGKLLDEMATTEYTYQFDCKVTQKLLDDLIIKFPQDKASLQEIKGNLYNVVANASQMSGQLGEILKTKDVDGKLDVYYQTLLTGDTLGNVMEDCGEFSAKNAEQIAGMDAFIAKHPGAVEKAYREAVQETKQEFNNASPAVGGLVASKGESFMNSAGLFSAPMQRPMRYPMMAAALADYTKKSDADIGPVLKDTSNYLRVASQTSQLSMAATQGKTLIHQVEAKLGQEAHVAASLRQ